MQENNADLAIIRLKHVVNMSPTYIRAYQFAGAALYAESSMQRPERY